MRTGVTELNLQDIKQKIPHCVGVSEEGWQLRWEEAGQPAFEVLCSGANALQIERLAKSLTAAYESAARQLV